MVGGVTFAVGVPDRIRPRALLVSDDDNFSAELKRRLPGVDVLSLTEDSVWVADRAGLDVTRGIDTVLLDHQLSGRVQLRLYEALRPIGAHARVPIIFTRSRLTAASSGLSHELDVYQREGADADATARLVARVLGGAPGRSLVDAKRSVPAAVAVACRGRRAGAAFRLGLLQRLGFLCVGVGLTL
jgi:hypothetical protein